MTEKEIVKGWVYHLEVIREELESERLGIIEEIRGLNAQIEALGGAKESMVLRNDREFLRGKSDGLLRSQNIVMGVMIESMKMGRK